MGKKAGRIISIILMAVLIVGGISIFPDEAYAGSSYKKTIKGTTTTKLSKRYDIVKSYFDNYDGWAKDIYSDVQSFYEGVLQSNRPYFYDLYDFDDEKNSWVSPCPWEEVYKSRKNENFTTTQKMCFVTPITIKIKYIWHDDDYDDDDILGVEKGGVRVTLKDEKGRTIQNDFINLKGYGHGDTYTTWLYSDGGIQKPGKYTYSFSTNIDPDHSCSVSYSIIGYTKYASSAKMKKSVSKRSRQWVKIGKLKNGAPLIKKISSSKKSVVPYFDVDKNGNIYAYARKKGTSKVTLQLKNGKKYKTRIKVKAGDPDFEAYLTDYNTRGNYFTVKVNNYGPSPVTIIRKGSKVLDCDYKKYDRYIKASDKVTVKAGKSKTIKFYIRGSTTWHNYKDFTLKTAFTYEGKKYQCKIWSDDSHFKKGSNWYYTYLDVD